MLSPFFETALGKALTLLVISATPVIELRGAIPIGAAAGLPFLETFFLCVIGNMLPVPFIILFARRLFEWLKGFRLFARPIHWLERHTLKKASTVHKYQMLGLIILVAIPLPGTGAWTGAILAALMDIRIQRAVPIILLGVLIAASIVASMSYGLIHAISIFAPMI